MYFYADRVDRGGNRLITSYGKEVQATKYGGASAKISEGLKYLNLDENGKASLGTEGDLLLRTLMIKPDNAKAEPVGGRFVVYGRTNGVWEKTPFRYSTYSIANSAVKSALITLFEACAVIEEPETEEDV